MTHIPLERVKTAKAPQVNVPGMTIRRHWTKEGIHPFEDVVWEKRTARITNEKGEVIFEQHDVEVPQHWSQTATNIVAQKYFRGKVGSPEREISVKQMVTRVARTMAEWGRKGGYFATEADARTFEDELTFMLITQRCAFNSPVWFNVGITENPQSSACFILSIKDSMDSILEWIRQEGMIFKGGSGSGINLSPLRSSKEALTGGGIASGPVSFMRGADASAGAIKSGGTTRRAAKMVILNADHPDILEFIRSKAIEEKKAWILGEHGYDMSLNGSAWHSIQFQNANNSVRATDAFMQAVAEGKEWQTHNITDGSVAWTKPAREVMGEIAQAAWQCGDPGMQFDTTINRWNPCPRTGRINASNPCSEYMFLDDSACNLASLNLMKFRGEDGEFDVEAFTHGVDVLITAMEIIVGNSGYPTPAITQNSHDYRPLGIGYSNLGALLMTRGVPYDSEEGRNYAAAVTALLSGSAYRQSARIAGELGPFVYFNDNRDPFLTIINMHRTAAWEIREEGVPEDLMAAARIAWDEAYEQGYKSGFRNAQISVLAPTGTISFLMDCDTTGIEPEIALVRYKWLVGGGMMKLVNNSVPEALHRLGYRADQIQEIMEYIEAHDTIEGAPHLQEDHLPIFDCAFKPQQGVRSISYMGHVRMMAAVQPFISGAISKTVNMPEEATPDDITQVYMEAWRLGLKAIAIYRDGCKKTQPLTTKKEAETGKRFESARDNSPLPNKGEESRRPSGSSDGEGVSDVKEGLNLETKVIERPLRKKLPDIRNAVTHKFTIGGHEGYLTVGLYEDGMPGEMFITMNKEGSTLSGLLDSFAVAISFALQYGVPLKFLVKKFAHVRFEPSGYTSNDRVRIAKSIVDYIFRWMAFQFLSPEDLMSLGLQTLEDQVNGDTPAVLPLQVKNGNGNEHDNGVVQASTILQSALPDTLRTKAAPALQEQVTLEENFAVSLTSMIQNQMDAPLCATCGSLMVRNASCYKCLNCGDTSGCS
ncbi:MAG: vitamin B12-dependent ribonucleotide reductase [Patescibacteria group bacterium]